MNRGRSYIVGIVLAAVAVALPRASGQTSAPATAPTSQPDPAAVRKAWSERAARAEAALRLVEQIRRLPAGDKNVGAFLDRSPAIARATALFFMDFPEGQTRFLDDGSARVSLSVPSLALAATLERQRVRYDQALHFRPGDFQQVARQPTLTVSALADAHAALVTNPPIPYRSGMDYFSRADERTRGFWTRHVSDPGRDKTERSARENALRAMLESVKLIVISPGVDVGDFAAGLGAKPTDLRQFLRPVRETWVIYYRDAPVIEADCEVSQRSVLACVKSWLMTRPAYQADDLRRVEQAIIDAGDALIRQTGVDYVDVNDLVDANEDILTMTVLASSAPAWVGSVFGAVGKATPDTPEARPDLAEREAIRNARWDARCKLADRLAGLFVDKSTKVEDLCQKYPSFRAALLSVLQDARIVGEPRYKDGVAQVTMEISTTPLWHAVYDQLRQRAKESPATSTAPASE